MRSPHNRFNPLFALLAARVLPPPVGGALVDVTGFNAFSSPTVAACSMRGLCSCLACAPRGTGLDDIDDVVVVEEVEFGGRECDVVLGKGWTDVAEVEDVGFEVEVAFLNSGGGIWRTLSACRAMIRDSAYLRRRVNGSDQSRILPSVVSPSRLKHVQQAES